MEKEFWLQLWREGRTRFHRDAPLPLLTQHWPSLGVSAGSRVLVPLCGKTLDMLWLAEQGYRVLGVELSPLAIRQFFDEHGLIPERHESRLGVHHVSGNLEIIQGDVFALDDATLAGCVAVYDRAAVVALPAAMRERYVHGVLNRLPAACRGLMVTLEYPQREMDGPPFSVDANMICTLLRGAWHADLLDRRDILAAQPDFRRDGVTSLHTAVYRLERKI